MQKINDFTSDKQLNEVFTPLHVPNDTAAFKPRNVVIIILESFSKEFIGAYNKGKGSAHKG